MATRKATLIINGKTVEAETSGSYYCLRCGRPLKTKRSQMREYGPICDRLRKPYTGWTMLRLYSGTEGAT